MRIREVCYYGGLCCTLFLVGCTSNEGGTSSVPKPTPVNPNPISLPSKPLPNIDNISKPPSIYPNLNDKSHLKDEGMFILSPAKMATDLSLNRKTKKVARLSDEDRKQVFKVFERTNQYRKEKGLPALKWDEDLAAYAQMRSLELVNSYNKDHKRPNGSFGYSEIIIKAGGATGENIASGQGNAEIVSLGWKNSPTHYKNIVNKKYDRIGIGFVRVPQSSDGKKYTYYWTQTFGGGNAHSPYSFNNKKQPQPNTAHILGENIKVADNKLVITGGTEVETDASRGYKNRMLSNPIYAKSLKINGTYIDLIVQDPKKAGFDYHTFAEVVDKNTKDLWAVQYVNIGKIMIPKNIDVINATYKGASLGTVNQNTHYYADVEAKITGKNMDIAFSNTRFYKDGHFYQYRGKKTEIQEIIRNLNFKDSLKWDGNKFIKYNKKTGEYIQAYFYGSKGEELGGQFERDINYVGLYQGAFGAKKVLKTH